MSENPTPEEKALPVDLDGPGMMKRSKPINGKAVVVVYIIAFLAMAPACSWLTRAVGDAAAARGEKPDIKLLEEEAQRKEDASQAKREERRKAAEQSQSQ